MTEREQLKQSIKRQLNSYRDLTAEHHQIAEELKRLELTMGSPTGSSLDGMPRGTDTSSPVERIVIQHITLQERYHAQLEQLLAAQIAIENMIAPLEPVERRVARFRYIDGLTWESICERMCYSWRQTHRIHGRMLDKLVAAELERRNA